MEVFWLSQCERDVPLRDAWLSAAERVRCGTLRIPKRKSDWLLGRWTAKLAIASKFGMATDEAGLSAIEVVPAESGAPEAFMSGERMDLGLSLSHSNGVAICTLADANVGIGCDLENIEGRSPAFLEDYFTADERSEIERVPNRERSLIVNLMWSAKESVLKALHLGLREDTRSVVVRIEPKTESGDVSNRPWRTFTAMHRDRVFYCLWSREESLVRTIASTEPITSVTNLANRVRRSIESTA